MSRRSLFPLFPFLALLSGGASVAAVAAPPPTVTVSILPMQQMVQELAGPGVTVSVLIPPGASPEQFEPSPSQIRHLSRSAVYFSVGADLEKSWMPRIRKQMPTLRVVDLGTPLADRQFTELERHSHTDHSHADHRFDPHLWTSPVKLIGMAEGAAAELRKLFPEQDEEIARRLASYTARLEALDRKIAAVLEPVAGEVLLVFHPAWGYFADRYRLKQSAIEQSGRAPGPQMLAKTIRESKKEKVTAIFVQTQMNQSVARAIAQELKIPVVTIDPLSATPETTLLSAAETIASHLTRSSEP